MIRAVIFDFNGVLVDDEHLHFELFRAVLAREGVELGERKYHEHFLGFDDRGCFEAALVGAGQHAGRGRVEDLIGRKAALYAERAREGLRIFPGAAEAVAALGARWPLAICSGALRAEIELVLELMGVGPYVAAVVAAEDSERCKPDPEGYLLALDALRSGVGEDLEAGHCLVVEDSLAGVRAGKLAGMWVVAVAHTYPAAELRDAGADAVLDDLDGLGPAWVEHFFAPEVSP
ncbi:MAG TPA: HAD family phosphatase [Isosphaeraceae bacterium]|jgi:HAD superfamily hydrolase (TIGR01509 family)|nr:HAD family phosphatase [Isosphaeraceae bacterium]